MSDDRLKSIAAGLKALRDEEAAKAAAELEQRQKKFQRQQAAKDEFAQVGEQIAQEIATANRELEDSDFHLVIREKRTDPLVFWLSRTDVEMRYIDADHDPVATGSAVLMEDIGVALNVYGGGGQWRLDDVGDILPINQVRSAHLRSWLEGILEEGLANVRSKVANR